MKYFVLFFCLFMIGLNAQAKETCIKTKTGVVLCGEQVKVERDFDDFDSHEDEKCSGINGDKPCVIDCKKTIFGSDCRTNTSQNCVDNLSGVICGYNCVKGPLNIAACASEKRYKCIANLHGSVCGINCKDEFSSGDFKCTRKDPKAKYLE